MTSSTLASDESMILYRHVFEQAVPVPVRDRRRTRGQRAQDRYRLRDGVLLERWSARQHQDHDRSGKIFTEEHGRHDRDSREVIGAELAVHRSPHQPRHERQAAGCEDDQQRHVGGAAPLAPPRCVSASEMEMPAADTQASGAAIGSFAAPATRRRRDECSVPAHTHSAFSRLAIG
jgi:hypothetical protein